jgi:2-polyprenyl-6-methoxyphenol hydroxylase-like FAD-dependent oxidoreductase
MAATLPVLIVGAGPTGLTLAIECCRYQIPFRLIDKLAEPTPYSKALAIWQGSMAVFAAQGTLSEFKQKAVPFKYAQFAYKGKVLATLDPKIDLPSGTDTSLLLAQSETEKILTARLEQLGGRVERGLELINVRNEKDHVLCEIKNLEGMTEVLHVSWLASCNGARSIARKYLEAEHQVEFKGYTEEDTFQLGDFEFTGGYENDQVFLSFTNQSSLGIIAVNPQVVRLIAKGEHNDAPTEAHFQALVLQHQIKNLTLTKPVWLATFKINERLATHWVKGRIILLGDAAHIHSPAGGQGMNTGIQDAFNLGWKLAHVLAHPRCTTELINSYEEERYPIVKKIVSQAAHRLHFAMKNNVFFTTIKRIGLTIAGKIPNVRKNILANLSELTEQYMPSHIINDATWPHYHDGIPAGKKMLDAHLTNTANNEISLFNACLVTSHVVLIFIHDHLLDPQIFKDLPKACKIMIIHTGNFKNPGNHYFWDKDGVVHDLYGANEPCWYLIRPDQIVAKRGLLHHLKPLNDYFHLLFA